MKPFRRTSLLLRSRQRTSLNKSKVRDVERAPHPDDVPVKPPAIGYTDYVEYFGQVSVTLSFGVSVPALTPIVNLREKVMQALHNDGFGLEVHGLDVNSIKLVSPSGECEVHYPSDTETQQAALLAKRPVEPPDADDLDDDRENDYE